MNIADHTDLSAYAGEDHIAIFDPRHEVIVSLTDHLIILLLISTQVSTNYSPWQTLKQQSIGKDKEDPNTT